MARQNIDNGETYGIHRGKVNANFIELYSIKLEASSVLVKDNTVSYTPTLPFHPATKGYADSLQTNWSSVFNPQDISADVFDRANHTGVLDPSVISQDANYRFVSDLQTANWNQKEDAIGVKGTAFNKNFGTIVGSVSEGNHTHTKADIGLGNVDNTSDVNKAVSTPQQAALDLKLDKTLADFTPQSSVPSYLEGRVFYGSESNTLSYQTDIPGFSIQIGKDQLVRMVNKTGSIILKGKACKQNGVDPVTSLPRIILAQANSVENARVLGLAAHDIPIDGEGFIKRAGEVDSINTSSHLTGMPLYLSDTVAGDYTTTPPDIVSQIGGCLISAVSGRIIISIINNVVLPTFIGIFQNAPDTYTMSGTGSYETIDNYQVSDSLGIIVDAVNGTLQASNDGWYRFTFKVTLTANAASAEEDILLRLQNITQGTTESNTILTVNATTLTVRTFVCDLLNISKDDVLELQIGSLDSVANITFDKIALDIASVNIKL